jgi:phosphoglycerol transferase
MSKLTRSSIAWYTGLSVFTLALLTGVMQLWRADWRVPFSYLGGDAFLSSVFIKGIIDHGWYLNNPNLGAPYGLRFEDFPLADGLHLLIIKLITLVTSEFGLALNLFFVSTFVLTSLTSFFVLRHFKLSQPVAALISLLYSFLPYHFLRGEAHLFLAAYFSVPLIVMLALEIWSPSPPFFSGGKFSWNRTAIWIALVALLIGTSGVYYAFFACFVLLVAAVATSFGRRTWQSLVSAGMLIALIAFGTLANVAPTLVYQMQAGKNTQVAVRSAQESEIYGLKLTQFVMPVVGHRVPFLANAANQYKDFPLPNEASEALGIIGSVGFMSLLLQFLWLRRDPEMLSTRLSILNLASLLLATIGGLGVFFALFVSPSIRAYNRISILIAFLALFQVGLLLEMLRRKLPERSLSRVAFYGGLGLLLIVGVLDQTSPHFIPAYDQARESFQSDREFISRIEEGLPKGSRIFQLPYVPFPENPPVVHMADYELFRGYLHSDKLAWSYGAMRGRAADAWQQALLLKPLDQQLDNLVLAGFRGLYLDRFGFADRGAQLEAQLQPLLGAPTLVSPNQRLVFFDLRPYQQQLKSKLGPAAWEHAEKTVMPAHPSWEGGFYGSESDGSNHWRWSSKTGLLALNNLTSSPKTVTLRLALATGHAEVAPLAITTPQGTQQLAVGLEPVTYETTLTLQPGRTLIELTSSARRVEAPQDPRELIFRVLSYELEEQP